MATLSKSHPSNVPGPLFVDTTCIDCGTCFHLAPSLFLDNVDDKSVVLKQPANEEEWIRAKRAILSCPTVSIGVHPPPANFKNINPGLPLEISEGIYYCGYTSHDSFGASSFLIQRADGNILIDCPKFHPWLVKELEKLGGVRWIFLSHCDDVADHKLFAKHFNAARIIHQDDVNADTSNCEMIVDYFAPHQFADDILIIPTPGHSKGHMCLLYKDVALFSGDHLFVDPANRKLRASQEVCWYSWQYQIESMENITHYTFEWVLPGHGSWGHFDIDEVQFLLKDLIIKMKGKK